MGRFCISCCCRFQDSESGWSKGALKTVFHIQYIFLCLVLFWSRLQNLINGHKWLDKVEEFSEQCLRVLDIAGAREHSIEFPKGKKPPIWRLCYLSFRQLLLWNLWCVSSGKCEGWFDQKKKSDISQTSLQLLFRTEPMPFHFWDEAVFQSFTIFSFSRPTAGSGKVFSSFRWSLIFIHSGQTHVASIGFNAAFTFAK